MNWSAEQDAMLRELRPQPGLTHAAIASAINEAHGTKYTHQAIARRAAELGMPKRHRWAPQRRASEWWRTD